jgi:hypothetical protein
MISKWSYCGVSESSMKIRSVKKRRPRPVNAMLFVRSKDESCMIRNSNDKELIGITRSRMSTRACPLPPRPSDPGSRVAEERVALFPMGLCRAKKRVTQNPSSALRSLRGLKSVRMPHYALRNQWPRSRRVLVCKARS